MGRLYRSGDQGGVLASLPIKTLWALWLIIIVVFIPFSIKAAVFGDYILSLSFLLFVLTASVYLYSLAHRKDPPLSVYLPLFCMCLAQSLGVYYTGIQAIFWAYPSVIVFYFVLPDRAANIISAWLIIQSSASLYLQTDLGMTLRFIFSMLVVCGLIRLMIDFVLSLKDKLISLSITDPLTGAFNRRHMDERLSENILSGAVATLLMIDIDHFKQVNDTYGHDAGDEVLIKLVSCLKSHSRHNDLVFRMGGEEFLMLLADTNKEQAAIYAEHLRLELAKIVIGESCRTITVSIGASEMIEQDSLDQWLKKADVCLYQAKNQGRNQVIMSA